ncbi:hypothetical protein [Enterobacter asburiae]|uniref:hypothetical protein n=1 Tax=Enterobacter asburiae TaxID=61645 RepID=UPI00292C4FA2|nr:hypothetical protein [Enterobacter asburiae]MDV1089918.1 hypothetical protein [Enterobacter asburiae]
MSTISKERLEQLASGNAWVCVQDDEAAELARTALASLEAEPAIHRWRRVTVEPYGPYPWHYGNFIGFSKPVEGIEDEYYYPAPPAPVSVPDEDLLHMAASAIEDLLSSKDRSGAGVWADVPARLRRAAMLQGAAGNSPVIPDWQTKAEKLAELHGSSFVVFRNGGHPQCADPSKVIISFTDEGLGHGAAAPQQEVK